MAKAQNNEANYKVTIISCSKEISAVERIKLKDLSDAVKLNEMVSTEGSVTLVPAYFAQVHVHNENADDKDYENYVIVDNNGTKYYTGSESLWSAFTNIMEELTSEGIDEALPIKVYGLPSKNRAGKDFLTCSLA